MVKIIKNLDNRGVTLIELIVCMSLSSIILITLLVVFSSETKAYNRSHNINEIQAQGQNIMHFMSSRIMTSNKIINIKGYEGTSKNDKNKGINLGELKLEDNLLEYKLLSNGSTQQEIHIFSVQKDPKMEGNSIRYGNIDNAKIELGNYIKAIYVKPLFDESIKESKDKNKENIYDNAKGIKLTIVMQKGKIDIEISKNIYFRNKILIPEEESQ